MKKFILLILIPLLFSCKDSDNNETVSNSKTGTGQKNLFKPLFTAKSQSGLITAVLESNRQQIKKLDPVEFKLKLTGKNDIKLNNVQVLMDLAMPEMAMPKNEIKLKETEPGTYTGIALFTMKGDWNLNTIVEIKKIKELIIFEVSVG
jgi:hypothetical protein